MTRIPDEYRAAKDLQRQFAEIGRERAGARRRAPRGARRVAAISFATLAVLAAGAGATKVFIVDGGEVSGERATPRAIQPAPGDARLSPARVPDPAGALPWGARTYVGRGGGTCVIVGQVQAGRLGVMRRREFEELPSGAPAYCNTLTTSDEALVARRRATAHRTVVYGIVGRDVRRVTITIAGRDIKAPIARDGVFLAVFRGAPRPTVVTLTGSRGTERRRFP